MQAGTVLVIDDDVWIRSAIAEVLIDEGFAVKEAADGASGLRLAEEVEPDLILLDLALPGHSGLEVLEELKAREPTCEIPVMIVSAYAMLLLPRSREANAHLQKPFDLRELLDNVNRLVKDSPPA